MKDEMLDVIAQRKAALRREVLARRREQVDKDALSDEITRKLGALIEYQAASVVMFYVDARSEVRTREAIRTAITSGKLVALPQCVGGELVPWRIESLTELAPGAFGILELPAEICRSQQRTVDPKSIDLVIVPGIAFDRRGQRLGSGRGFYDRFIPRLRKDTTLVGLAFDCQVVDQIPAAPHDVPVHIIVTPSEIIES